MLNMYITFRMLTYRYFILRMFGDDDMPSLASKVAAPAVASEPKDVTEVIGDSKKNKIFFYI